ncbi:MAG: endonuclease [Clostridium sp.]
MRERASLEIKNKAIELYKSGVSANCVANDIGYNEATVRGWLKEYKVDIRKGGMYNKKYSDETVNKIIKLYKTGLYTTDIDNILELRSGVAQYLLNKNNFTLRHRGPKSKIGNENYFDVIDSEDKAYFLGYIMADGNVSITNEQYSLKIHIAIQDKEIVDKFLKVINSSNKTKVKTDSKSYYVSLTSVHMCKSLIKLGVIPNKTGKEIIPKEIPDCLISHYIRGIFDGDGITDISRKRSGFVGSVNIINDILKILNENLTTFEAGKNKKVVYFLGGKKFSKKLYYYLYKDANVWLERKRARLEYIYS